MVVHVIALEPLADAMIEFKHIGKIMNIEEIKRRFDFFKKEFDYQRWVCYNLSSNYWRFRYDKSIYEGDICRTTSRRILVKKEDDADKEFKTLCNVFKRCLKNNEGIEWYFNTRISKQMFKTYDELLKKCQ